MTYFKIDDENSKKHLDMQFEILNNFNEKRQTELYSLVGLLFL